MLRLMVKLRELTKNENMEHIPKVSIVCAWYNRADYIRETVDSLLNQDFDDYEIIIANDGSTDSRVKEILDSYDDPRLTVIHKENEGFTPTIKALVDKATAPYIAIQGAGEVSLPNRIAKQYAFLSKRKEYCLVGCSSVNVLKKFGAKDIFIKNNGSISGDITVNKKINSHPITHGSIMFEKIRYLKSGGYRVVFKYAQDYDLFLRISRFGKCFNLGRVMYQRNIFLGGVSADPKKSFEQAMFVKLANKCNEVYSKSRVDPIDQYGNLSLLLYSLDLQSRVSLFKVIIKLVFMEKYDDAKAIILMSSGWGIRLACLVFVSGVESNGLLRSFFKKSMKVLLPNTVFIQSNG